VCHGGVRCHCSPHTRARPHYSSSHASSPLSLFGVHHCSPHTRARPTPATHCSYSYASFPLPLFGGASLFSPHPGQAAPPPRPAPAAHCPSSHAGFPPTPFWGSGSRSQFIAMHGWWQRLWLPAGIFPWIALAAVGAVPGGWGWGVCLAHEACVSPHPHWVQPPPTAVPYSTLALADAQQLWTKGHDKLGMGVTRQSHKKLWYEFPMGGQCPSKYMEEKADRDKPGGRTGEGPCE
jgi:hypothetical protein